MFWWWMLLHQNFLVWWLNLYLLIDRLGLRHHVKCFAPLSWMSGICFSDCILNIGSIGDLIRNFIPHFSMLCSWLCGLVDLIVSSTVIKFVSAHPLPNSIFFVLILWFLARCSFEHFLIMVVKIIFRWLLNDHDLLDLLFHLHECIHHCQFSDRGLLLLYSQTFLDEFELFLKHIILLEKARAGLWTCILYRISGHLLLKGSYIEWIHFFSTILILHL